MIPAPLRHGGRRLRILALASLVSLALVVAFVLAAKRVHSRSPADAYAGFPDVHPSLLVTNPRTLLALETDGFSLGDVLAVRPRNAPRPVDYHDESAQVLARSPAYADLVAALARDLDARASTNPFMGVGAHFEHRLFDLAWLGSPRAHFELVGVVNRIDVRALAPPGCGETRLVYRLAYRPPNRPETRLPMTVNVIYDRKDEPCADVARRWLAVDGAHDVALALRRGPLQSLDVTRFDRVEVDVQSVRENSKGASMDDHAEYILRTFAATGGRLVPEPLVATPDPGLSGEQKDALRAWVAGHLDAIEEGVADVPAEFLARSSVSFTPRGLARAANHPWKTLFPDEKAAFGDLDLQGRHVVTSPWLLVRRLDEMTCPGCHQSRTVAGFHLLGEDRSGDIFNGMVLGMSEHLREILDWRYQFLVAAGEGGVYDVPVPLAERVSEHGDRGAHCSTSGRAGRPVWPCAEGLVCDYLVEDDPVGECVRRDAKELGDPCQDVALVSQDTVDGDKVTPSPPRDCTPRASPGAAAKRGKCEPNRNGFAGGMCTATCGREGDRRGDAICVRIPHHGFEAECFKEGAVIERCLQKAPNFAMTFLRTCSRTEPCRDDFVCGRIPSLPPDKGACVPPYFIFQARVDGPPIDR